MADETKLYEGLFLLEQGAVASDFKGTIDRLNEIFERADAQVEVMTKWEERKLAYEINGQKRGSFILAYFNARGPMIVNIERDVELSEQILRCLILRADHIGETELELAKKDANLDVEAALRDGDDDSSSDDSSDSSSDDKGDDQPVAAASSDDDAKE